MAPSKRKIKETTAVASDRGRNVSGGSRRGSRGRHQSGGSGYGSVHWSDSGQGAERYVRRLSSTASTDRPFDRQASRLSQVSSGKSLASVRTRLCSITASEYHVDLKPELTETLNINLVFACFIIVFGSSFQFGYNIGVLNQPAHLIKEFFNKTYTERDGHVTETKITVLWSLTNALFIPGGMCGAFLGGWLADKLGRKKSILLSHLFAYIGAALSSACVAAKAPELLMLGRIFVGVNSGLGNCIAPMFLSEIAPVNLRGAFGTVHQLFVTIGILLSSVLGIHQILGTATLWPFLILLEAIPATVSLLILPCLPDTPRYLLLVNKDRDGARKSLEFYRRRDDVETHMEEMDTETQKDPNKTDEAFKLKELFSKSLIIPLGIAAMLQVMQQFSGINAIFFYSNGIFKSAGVPDDQIPYAVIGTNAVNVAMTVISVPMMEVAGRRLLLLIPMGGMIIDLAIITMSLNLQSSIWWMSYISVAAVIFYVICFAVGLELETTKRISGGDSSVRGDGGGRGCEVRADATYTIPEHKACKNCWHSKGPIPMMIGSELFRQGPRPYAMAVAGVVNWLGTFVIAMAFEPVQLVLKNYTFLVFLILMILFLVFTYFKVPETKGKTFEEIASQFAPGGEIEVEEVVEDDEEGEEEQDPFDDPVANEAGDKEDHQLVTLNFDNKSEGSPTEDGDGKKMENAV